MERAPLVRPLARHVLDAQDLSPLATLNSYGLRSTNSSDAEALYRTWKSIVLPENLAGISIRKSLQYGVGTSLDTGRLELVQTFMACILPGTLLVLLVFPTNPSFYFSLLYCFDRLQVLTLANTRHKTSLLSFDSWSFLYLRRVGQIYPESI
ncbi:hypothetical protein K435DRAFT_423583 [Dendrothele bispora CBS 962.96]|uniref:Uncharacterized protein n=1 Tax=Dendrothele bispora (strain CBS 962.96) TaxID=1314807 RepID=A0A4S8L5R3_DENBC|nr:hypothetical protein K435DRAFT_423583 [Dendrothele bispora CBS 962.96]